MTDHTGIAQRSREWSPDHIRALRHRLALSQPDFAKLLEVSTKTVSFWETGRAAPSWARVRQLRAISRDAKAEEEEPQ